MMALRTALIALGLAATPVLAQEQPSAAPGTVSTVAEAMAKLAACEGQKFEFKAGEEKHPSKVSLCSKKDASKDEIVRMLDDAAVKIQANGRMSANTKAALVAQIKAKVIEIQSAQ